MDTLHPAPVQQGWVPPQRQPDCDTDSENDVGSKIHWGKGLQTALDQYCRKEWNSLPHKQASLFSSPHIPKALGFEILAWEGGQRKKAGGADIP